MRSIGVRGVSLVEVLVALSILSVVLIALGGLMFQVGRQTRNSAAATYRSAAVQRGSAVFEILPWADIDGRIGCSSRTSESFTYHQCVSVANVGSRGKSITIVITPTGAFTARPETVTVFRNLARAASPIR